MQVLSFAEMVAFAVALGAVDGPVETMPQWDQICAVLTAQDVRLKGTQPALDDEFNGGTVWHSALTGWVVDDEAVVPITLHCGYSENGCTVLYSGQLYQWATMADPVEVPAVVWDLLQKSVWPAAG